MLINKLPELSTSRVQKAFSTVTLMKLNSKDALDPVQDFGVNLRNND